MHACLIVISILIAEFLLKLPWVKNWAAKFTVAFHLCIGGNWKFIPQWRMRTNVIEILLLY